MIFFGIFTVFLAGWQISRVILPRQHTTERWANAFLLGIGLQSFFMLLCSFSGITISIAVLAVSSLVVAGAFYLIGYYQKPIPNNSLKPTDSGSRSTLWYFLVVLIVVLAAIPTAQSFFWPTLAYDAVAGFDLLGKVIAAEGTLNVSLYELDVASKRGVYPPMISGGFAWAYLWGAESSRLVTALFFLAFIGQFYGMLRRRFDRLMSIIFTLLLVSTPELFTYANLSVSNIPAAIYATAGLIYLLQWRSGEERGLLWMSALMLGLCLWTRADSVVFAAIAILVVAYFLIREKSWLTAIGYTAIVVLPLALWQLYLSIEIGMGVDRFVDQAFWDGGRLWLIVKSTFLTMIHTYGFGLVFWLPLIAILLLFKERSTEQLMFLLMTFGSLILYMAVFYFLDDAKQDSINILLSSSLRRGLFAFVGPMLYLVALTPAIERAIALLSSE